MGTAMAYRLVDQRIADYEDKWLAEHKVAQLCFEFEDNLSGYVEVFRSLLGFDRLWREEVFTGEAEYSEEMEADIRSLFERWLASDGSIEDILAFFEGQEYQGGVKGAIKYRECAKRAKAALASWKKPELSASVALHAVKLNAEQSREFIARFGSPSPPPRCHLSDA